MKLKIRDKKILLCLMIVLSCWLVEATSQPHPNTTLSVHSRQKRTANSCTVGSAASKAFFAVVGVVAGAVVGTATFGTTAPLATAAVSALGSSALGSVECKKESSFDTILANQKQLREDLKKINENVKENGRRIKRVEGKVEFGTIVSLYGPEIISLRTAKKAYYHNLSFKRNGAIVKNAAQRRFMNDALGHGPGSQFRGLESLMDFIRHGTGIVAGGQRESIYREDNFIPYCSPDVHQYFNNLILEGANILFVAKAMNGEEITGKMKKKYQDFILENEKLYENCDRIVEKWVREGVGQALG